MKKFYIFSLITYGFLNIHMYEELLRLGPAGEEGSVLLVLALFPLGFILLYLKKTAGFWITWLVAMLIAIFPTLSHLIPSSTSHLGVIYDFWGATYGAIWVGVAVALSFFAILSVIFGGLVFRKRSKLWIKKEENA